MIFHRFYLLLIAAILLIPGIGKSQISQGGEPMKTGNLKSSRNRVVVMPPIKNLLSVEKETNTSQTGSMLKPFQFAYPFEVNLTPDNSGEWLQGENGYDIWKLTIRSAGAKSINLVFDDFKLPENARLFIYSETDNYILGAFTSVNNKSSGKFAISPVLGDEITVQYEIPESSLKDKYFRITSVNHDYIGILKSGDRRPLDKIAGACNIDINCDDWEEWNEVKNSVCRLIVNGKEICTGVLVNNTAENQKPYILSAAHCYDKWNYPETTVYTFNYESPFCAPLDGDPSNSITGAIMKARSDSLDFALVELSLVPPPDFRPYYAGWNRSVNLPSSTVSIHHPQGDIKKLAVDNNFPEISSFGEPNYTDKNYIKNGFLRINRWDRGVTEAGSSGGPLFDVNKNVIGTLTGGEATCKNPIYDYFERFFNAWDLRADTTKQLKYWLDPLKLGVQSLNGKQFNEGENLCGAFTNLSDNDDYEMVPLLKDNKFAGYWGGSNSVGLTEIMERFSIPGNEILSGLSFGVGKFKSVLINDKSEIKVKVYNGHDLPEQLIYSQVVKTANLAEDAMNFIGFNENVEPDEIFFIGIELSNIQPLDSFVVYQSLREATETNFFYFKQNGTWYNFKDSNPTQKSMANVFELVACNIDDFNTDTPNINNPMKIYLFPNPVNSKFTLETTQDIVGNQVDIFNVLGQKTEVKTNWINNHKLNIDLTGNVPGVYFVRFQAGNKFYSSKISFVPW